MRRNSAAELASRLIRPLRVGLLGRQGVGKTTLLTMLYREAVEGRLPGLRLAAGDAATAAYLQDRIGQLELGLPLPATLDQTELRFVLHHAGSQLELLMLDYQGEHVELGRSGPDHPVRSFFRDCDAVLLCLDASVVHDAQARWQAEQEIEQAVEDYLASQSPGQIHRPMALVITRVDLLDHAGDVVALRRLFEPLLRMTRHTLDTHFPWHGIFAVSSTGSQDLSGQLQQLQPNGLEGPLLWLIHALDAQDAARLEQLWQLSRGDLRPLRQATTVFLRRYGETGPGKAFRQRLSSAKWRQRGRRLVAALCLLAGVLAGAWYYDSLGAAELPRTLQEQAGDPISRLQVWENHCRWYPTRHLFRRASLAKQDQFDRELRQEVMAQLRQQRLAELTRQANEPDTDPESLWADLQRFRQEFPTDAEDSQWLALRQKLEPAAQQAVARREQGQLQRLQGELEALAAREGLDKVLDRFGTLLREYPAGAVAEGLQEQRRLTLQRIDERDYAQARDYSTRHPLDFLQRGQRYQSYLDRHPTGEHAAQAREELKRIAQQWDQHDYLAVRDAFLRKPGDLESLRKLGRAYLAAHPQGRWLKTTQHLLRWCDQVAGPGEYRVVLESGSFTKKAAATLSLGVSLSVELEVAGVRYGPSSIVRRSYYPQWQHEFARKIRWKVGDPVRIIVTDHYLWKRRVGDITFDEDPLALQKLNGEVELNLGSLLFSSDFKVPQLPSPE